MSSLCAPRHNTESGCVAVRCGVRRSMRASSAPRSRAHLAQRPVTRPLLLPHYPGRFASCVHSVELDLVFEGVHGLPKARVAVREQLALLNQTLEGPVDQLFAFANHVEDLTTQHEKSAVDPEFTLADPTKIGDQTGLIGINRLEAL